METIFGDFKEGVNKRMRVIILTILFVLVLIPLTLLILLIFLGDAIECGVRYISYKLKS